MSRDAFGFVRAYAARGLQATSVRALFGAFPDLPRTLDPIAVAGHFGDGIPPGRSLFTAIRAEPLGSLPTPHAGDLVALLRAAVAEGLGPRPVAVALSGGLDSAIVLALVHAIDPAVPALILDVELAGYSERETALATARAVGAEAIVETVRAEEFVAAVPDAIAAMEVPLYNLHPVSKWLLALAAQRAGFAALISGDGADQVMTRDTSADYLPLASAAFERAGVSLRAPFLDTSVVAHLTSQPSDPDKRVLRELAATLPVPRALVTDRKVSRLAPTLDLGVTPARIAELARLLGREPVGDPVRWATLALLADAFGAG